MKRSLLRPLSFVTMLLVATTCASAGTITQWGFNKNQSGGLTMGTGTFNNANVSGVSSGTGIGSGLSLLLANSYPAGAFGSPGDVNIPVSDNGYTSHGSAQPTDASGQGIQYHVSTIGQSNISFKLDFKPGSRASKYWQIYYTVDGSTWQTAPATGIAAISDPTVYAGSTITNSGLITIAAPTNITSTAAFNTTAGWLQGLEYQFPAGGAWENNPNFAVGFYQIYNPNQSLTSAVDYGYVSAAWGTNSTDTTQGYIRSGAAGGTQRFDLVTISGVPEPTSIAAFGAAGLLALARRRRNQS